MTKREISIACPFCATGLPPGRRALLAHALRSHLLGLVAWTALAVWLLGMYWAILTGPNPPPTLP